MDCEGEIVYYLVWAISRLNDGILGQYIVCNENGKIADHYIPSELNDRPEGFFPYEKGDSYTSCILEEKVLP